MKAKKGKNVSVQISLYSVFDELSNIEYLQQFRNHPQFLAAQIDDLKTLLQFASSNYTQKARSILNLSRQFTKSIESTLQGVNQINMGLYRMPQLSYPEMAYEALKRGTSLQLQEDGNQELDWRAVQTQFQLKFLESKNLEPELQWQKCYNPQQRCIQISKNNNNKSLMNGHMFLRQHQNNSIQVDLSLKIQSGIIVWDVKKVTYQNNLHYGLLSFYKEDLMQWVRQQHTQSIQQSDKYVLSLIHKSLDYIDVILLFMQLKNTPFNQNIQEADKKNGILNLFDPNQVRSPSHFKSKNIKVCFLLPFSNLQPSIILRVDGLNVLKIQFTSDNKIIFKIKMKNKKQQMTLKKLIGSIKKMNFSLKNLIDVAEELLQCLQTYESFVQEKVEQYKLDIFLSNRTTNLVLYFRNINVVLVEQDISQNQKINQQIDLELAQGNMQFSGLYLVFNSQYFPLMPPIILFISDETEILLKSSNTLCGFVDKILKIHPSMTFEEVMYHLHFFNIVQEAQQKSNWNTKLVYCDIYMQEKPIVYKFKIPTPKKVTGQSSILKKDSRQQHLNPIKDYSIHVKISQNFKTINFVYVTPFTVQNQNSRNEPSMNGSSKNDASSRVLYKPNESQIPDKYFKDNWKDYIKKRNDSQVLKNQYLDPSVILKATHYVLNHLQFNHFIKKKTGIFKTQQMVNLMDQ